MGSVAHLRPVKNFPRLLDVVERLATPTGLHLILLGDGPERAALEARVARPPLNGRVHLVGHIDDPRPYFRAMNLFAVSSDSEQMPVTLLEAMASGLPVASTRVGDIPHMLPAEQRPFVISLDEPDVVGRLAAATAHLVADPAQESLLVAEGRSYP